MRSPSLHSSADWKFFYHPAWTPALGGSHAPRDTAIGREKYSASVDKT
jgi:hypothetical protein